MIDERKKATKRVEELESELAKTIAQDLLNSCKPAKQLVVHKHRTDDSSNALGFLSSIATAFINAYEDPSNERKASSYTIALTSSPSMQTATSITTVLLFGSDEKQLKAYADLTKSKLGVKGGGKGTKWSGKFIGVWKEHREGLMLEQVLKGIAEN